MKKELHSWELNRAVTYSVKETFNFFYIIFIFFTMEKNIP